MAFYKTRSFWEAARWGNRVLDFNRRLFNTLVWLWVFAAVFALKPSTADAARKKVLKSESPKTKTTPTAQKATPTPPQKIILKEPQNLPGDPSDIREHVVQRTKPGETLLALINRFRLSLAEKQLWTSTIKRNFGSERLPAGKEVDFYFTKPSTKSRTSPSQLDALEFDYNDSWSLTWEKGPKGILFQKREKPYDVEIKTASAVVDHSFFEDGQKAGIQATLLSQIADIFNWDLDLEKDIHKGDSVKLLFEKRSRKGQESKASLRVLAAELINAGQKFTAIYFEKQKGMGNYYNLEGRSLARSFLRFPLEFTNITSYFSHSRFNPVLKVNMPHTGVDFAAQRGTPVRAVGDGVVTQAGWNGGYGGTIDIQRDSPYASRSAHLERFADGIRAGVSVI